MAARVICISRTSGALGVEVAKLVSERLGFRYLDEEIVSRVAAREKLDPDLVADVERRKSLVVRLLEQIDLGGRVEAEALTRSPGEGELGDPERYRGLIREAVRETAAQGEVVIVSHAASFALAGQDGLLAGGPGAPSCRGGGARAGSGGESRQEGRRRPSGLPAALLRDRPGAAHALRPRRQHRSARRRSCGCARGRSRVGRSAVTGRPPRHRRGQGRIRSSAEACGNPAARVRRRADVGEGRRGHAHGET